MSEQPAVKKTAPAKKQAPAQSATPGKKQPPAKKQAPAKQVPAESATPDKQAAPTKKQAPAKQAAPAKKQAPAKQVAPGKKQAPPAKKVAPAKATKDVAEAAPDSPQFGGAKRRARKMLRDPEALIGLAQDADKKSQRLRTGPMSKLLAELRALLRLIRAYARGDYRDIAWESMVLIVGAVIYVVSPLDLIPDAIPVVGHLDDAAILGFVLNLVRDELTAFVEWEGRGSST